MFFNCIILSLVFLCSISINAGIYKSLQKQQNLLHLAVKSDDKECIEELLYHDAALQALDERDEDGLTALHIALRKRNVFMAERLLGYGADANSAFPSKESPLKWVALQIHAGQKFHHNQDNMQMLKLLIEKGAHVDGTINNLSVLEYVWRQKETLQASETWRKTLHDLIDRVDMSQEFKPDANFFSSVIIDHNYQVAEAVINKTPFPSLNQPRFLSLSIQMCPKIALKLIDAGVDVGSVDEKGRTPLHHALNWNQEAVIKKLIENGADPNALDENNHTPLTLARASLSLDSLKLLIRAGADLSSLVANDFALLKDSMRANKDGLSRLIIIHGLPIEDEIDDLEFAELKFLEGAGDEEVERNRLKEKIRADRQRLITAIENNNSDSLAQLLNDEHVAACVDARTQNSSSPLEIAHRKWGAGSTITSMLQAHSLRKKKLFKSARK